MAESRQASNIACVIDGCTRPKGRSRGMCHTHYAHYLKHGDPLGGNFHPTSRGFETKIDKSAPNGCWLWLGTTNKRSDKAGYAQTKIDGKKVLVHRVLYEMHYGPIPDGWEIDHLCRVERCVNPAHLEAVTRQENLARRVFKKRQVRV